jgi:predicted PurR-regulated permease PerM
MDSNRFEQYARLTAAALLVVGCFYILQPFIGAMLFAGILCLTTWPAFIRVRARAGGRSWLAALILVLVMVLALALPVALAAQSIVVHSSDVVDAFRRMLDQRSSFTLPDFVRNIPAVGPWLDDQVRSLLQASGPELIAFAKSFAEPAKVFITGLGAAFAAGFVQVLLAIFVAYFFYRDGEFVRRLLLEAVTRLAGREHGVALVDTAQSALKGVIYGLVGTAVAQALVALLGFLIAGVPGALLLAALTFVLSLVPMGPVLIWGGAAAWLYFHDSTGWAIFMVVYGIAVISSVDNFVKPILMSRAGNLSMLLVVLGVFGGAIAFGFIGLFVGPALLAVAWALMKAWLKPAAVETANDSASP